MTLTACTRRRLALGAALLALLAAGPEVAHGEEGEPFWDYVMDNLEQRHEIVGFLERFSPSDNATNPNNRIKRIQRDNFSLELRPNFSLALPDQGVSFNFEPRLLLDRTRFTAGAPPHSTNDDIRASVYRYAVRLHDVIPDGSLVAERNRIEWGPGFFSSPSNAFGDRAPAINPLIELPTKDYLWAGGAFDETYSWAYFWNFNDGTTPRSGPHYDRIQLAQLKGVFSTWSGVLLGGYQENHGAFAGSYGTWTANDATLLYWDGIVRQGSDGLYPTTDPGLPSGGLFAPTKTGRGRLFPELLLGVSYTTLANYTLTFEYFYYGPGFSDDELRRSRELDRRAASLIDVAPQAALATLGSHAAGETDEFTALPEVSLATLGSHASNGLESEGRHHLVQQVTKTFGTLETVVQHAHFVQDHSGQLFASLTYHLGPHSVSLSGLLNYGAPDSLAREDLNNLVVLVYRLRL